MIKFTEENIDNLDTRPPWAIGYAEGYSDVGAQLATRNGQCVGNAVVISFTDGIAKIITDAGTKILFTIGECEEFFYPPRWCMDPKTAPGLK